MKEEFDKHAPGSAFSVGPQDTNLKIVLMHGQGSSAEYTRSAAQILSTKLPTAEIIVPNGSYVISDDFIPENRRGAKPDDYTPFTWYHPDQRKGLKKEGADALDTRLAALKSDPDNHVHLVGFSMGGFRAAEEFLKAPDDFKGAVLHSSAILAVPKDGIKSDSEERKPRLLTLMGTKDPYLRQKWVAALLPVHYMNQWKVNRAGIEAKTAFQWGLAHEMTDKSLTRVAQHISTLEAE